MTVKITRRDSLKYGLTLGVAAYAGTALADHHMKSHAADAAAGTKTFAKDSESSGGEKWDQVHGGNGTIMAKPFPFNGAADPANFVTYDIPPNASEGVHTHILNDQEAGSYDEFYYIVSGDGQMEIDGDIVPVKAGDHVFTPIGVAHGIENTSATANLKVFLTFITR